MKFRGLKSFQRGANALTLTLLATSAAAADSWQDTGTIRAAALEHAENLISRVGGEVDIDVNELDPRLRLRQCEQPLETYLPSGADLSNGGVVGVRCRGPAAWKIFVPVAVRRHALVARTTRALSAGHRLGPEDVEWVRKTLRASRAALIKNRDPVVGKVLRQPSMAGQEIRPHMLQAAFIVRRGDQVTLAVSNSGLAIRMRGEALANAALGQRVQARNHSSGRVVEGIVRAQGLVELELY